MVAVARPQWYGLGAGTAWLESGSPHKRAISYEIECYMDGERVRAEDFHFVPGRVFGDGSAPGAGWDELEEMGASATQLGEDGVARVVRLRVSGMPAAAVAAEHVAFWLIVMFCSGESIAVLDCLAVILGYQKWRDKLDRADDYSNPYAGMWRRIAKAQLASKGVVGAVEKVKAHCSISESEMLGQSHLHEGNCFVDIHAGLAAGAVGKVERIKYEAELGKRVKLLRHIGVSLADMELPDWAKLGRVGVSRRNGARAYSHRVLWSEEYKQWRCGDCGKRAAGCKELAKRRIARRPCAGAALTDGIGNGHQVHIGWMDGEKVLAVCSRCGCQRAGPGRGLAANCNPAKAVRIKVNRVKQGKHPTSGVKFDLVSAWAGHAGNPEPSADDHMAEVVLGGGLGELDCGLELIDTDRLEAMAAGLAEMGAGEEDGDVFGGDGL